MMNRALTAAAFSLALFVACSSGDDAERPPLVCLISVDTLRADRLGAYGSDRGLTPRLDELASQGVVFERSYAPSSFTVPSMSTVHTSLYPEENAIYINEHRLHDDVPTLAEGFRSVGYRTGAVVSNYVLRRASGLDRGFDEFDDRQPAREEARDLPERLAHQTTDDALSVLDRLQAGDETRPTFLWVHYQDPHGPYTPPTEFLTPLLERERARPGGDRRLPFGKDHRGLDGIPTYQKLGDHDEVAFYLASYDAEIRFTDQEIGRLLDGFEERGLLEQAVIAFTADHGEGLGENDYWFAHGEYLTDPLVRVPLIWRGPTLPTGERRTDTAALIDVLPTLFGRAGVASPRDARGIDLFAGQPQRRPLYQASLLGATAPRFAVIEDGYQYTIELTVEPDGTFTPKSESLRRIGSDENLIGTDRVRANALRKRMDEVRSSLQSTRKPILGPQGDPDHHKRMQDLGYV